MTHSMTQEKRSERRGRARFAQVDPADQGAPALQAATQLAALAHDLNQNPMAQANQELQAKFDGTPHVVAQMKLAHALSGQAAQRMGDNSATALSNQTGLPDRLKAGVEQISGTRLDHVRVHYNSSRPAQLHASAFTQGGDIHVGPGQERHLPHEAWHAAQQLQGRVAPTVQLNGVALNTDAGLEHEADVMGARALEAPLASTPPPPGGPSTVAQAAGGPVQRYFDAPHDSEIKAVEDYVAKVRPDLLRTFYQIRASDDPINLYDWLEAQLHVNMHGVYDWQDGIVRSQPLYIGEEAVRGSGDIPEVSDEEMGEFDIGLNVYTTAELEMLHHELGVRGAPHDRQRREILRHHASGRLEPRMMNLDEDEEDEEAYSDDMVQEPNFSDSENDGSGTETDGSDSDDDASYRRSDSRRAGTAARLEREEKLLNPKLVGTRLNKLDKAMSVKGKAKKRLKREEEMRAVMFKKGKRPANKETLHRKEAKFLGIGGTVGDRAKLPEPPTEEQTMDLAQLNALLDLGVPIALVEQVVASKFVVAQYRGLFYSRATFNQRSRARHRALDETNQPVFSSSALADGRLGPAGYYYLYGTGRQADLNSYQRLVTHEAERIRGALLALRKRPPQEETRLAAGRATSRFAPRSMADIGTHLYSQDYDAYHQGLAKYHQGLAKKRGREEDDEEDPLRPLFKGLTNAANPKVSTGDVPTHAARYAYGLKPYSGHEDKILEPDYDDSGKPKHPYSGRMYVSLHPLTDYDEDGPEQLIELQRQRRINIGQVILPERETQFEGMMVPGRVKEQMTAKFPNFAKEYKAVFAEKYGLSEELFDAFKMALQDTSRNSDERVFVEALLSNYLAMHSEIRAIEAAMRAADQQGATLVYRTGPRSFGFEPTPIKGESAPRPEPLGIKVLLELLVGEGTETSHKAESKSRVPDRVPAGYGELIPINGNGFACYIRSLVTAAARQGFTADDQIEDMVNLVQQHLADQNLRNVGQDIDAGGLVAAEVRRVLNELLNDFDPAVHILMDNGLGGWTEFTANTGTHNVYLRYTPGHFDLLTGPEG